MNVFLGLLMVQFTKQHTRTIACVLSLLLCASGVVSGSDVKAIPFISSADASSNTAVSKTVEELGPVAVGKPFPTFGGHTLDGGYLSLKTLENHDKFVVVSYFATWCAPCRHGLPKIEAFAQDNDNVVAVYVALGERSPAPLQKFAKELGLNSQIVIDKFETIGARHGVTGQGQDTRLPRTFVLAPDGTVKSIFVIEGNDFDQALTDSIQ